MRIMQVRRDFSRRSSPGSSPKRMGLIAVRFASLAGTMDAYCGRRLPTALCSRISVLQLASESAETSNELASLQLSVGRSFAKGAGNRCSRRRRYLLPGWIKQASGLCRGVGQHERSKWLKSALGEFEPKIRILLASSGSAGDGYWIVN